MASCAQAQSQTGSAVHSRHLILGPPQRAPAHQPRGWFFGLVRAGRYIRDRHPPTWQVVAPIIPPGADVRVNTHQTYFRTRFPLSYFLSRLLLMATVVTALLTNSRPFMAAQFG